jgi:hypothetical protein
MEHKNLEPIKQAIMSGHRRGICNSSGESVLNEQGILVAKPSKTNSASKTFVVRNGKIVEKC